MKKNIILKLLGNFFQSNIYVLNLNFIYSNILFFFILKSKILLLNHFKIKNI
jgi:hypothetical protein